MRALVRCGDPRQVTGVGLGLLHPRPQRLHPDTELAGYPGVEEDRNRILR